MSSPSGFGALRDANRPRLGRESFCFFWQLSGKSAIFDQSPKNTTATVTQFTFGSLLFFPFRFSSFLGRPARRCQTGEPTGPDVRSNGTRATGEATDTRPTNVSLSFFFLSHGGHNVQWAVLLSDLSAWASAFPCHEVQKNIPRASDGGSGTLAQSLVSSTVSRRCSRTDGAINEIRKSELGISSTRATTTMTMTFSLFLLRGEEACSVSLRTHAPNADRTNAVCCVLQ